MADGRAMRIPRVTIVIATLAITIALVPPLQDALVLDRHAVADGQLWRVATGNLVHFSPSHLLYDLLVVTVAGALLERAGRAIGGAVAVSAVAIGIAVLLVEPGLERYGGLSGVAYTLTVMLALDAILASGLTRAAGSAMLALALAKLWWELHSGAFLFVGGGEASFRAVPLAHAVGAAVGALAIVARRQRLTRLRHERQVLEVEAEVGEGRDGPHHRVVDRAVGVEGEGDVGVGAQLAIAPADDEGVVLPVHQVADEPGSVREAHHELPVLLGDRDVAIPGIAVLTSV